MAQAPGSIRADAYALTDSQLRILAVLAAAPGAAVGTAHVAAVTGDPGAPAELEHLERLGWAKSASPRYRLVHELPGGAPEPPSAALMRRLTDYVAEGPPVADDAEAIEAALLHAVRTEDWKAGAELARAAERPLATAGLLGSWERVLHAGHHAASRSGHDGDTALFLHELGSRAMCLTQDEEAIDLLTKALEIRERIGDDRGAELTRHNLDQIRGGGVPPKKSGLRPNRPRPGIALAVLVVAVAALFGLLQVTGDDGDKPRTHPHRSAAKREATRAPAAPPRSTPPAPGHVRPPAGGPVVTPGTDGGSTGSGSAGSGSETGDSGSNDPAKVPPPG
jgi:hypothetical protein